VLLQAVLLAANLADASARPAELELRQLRRMLEEILDNQERIARGTAGWMYSRPACCDPDSGYDQGRFQPQIGDVPLLVVLRGTTFKVRHTLKWRQYREDTLAVEIATTSSEVTVPKKLLLEFEKNELEFEYEVRVGAPGDYTIVLTPAVGEVVMVHLSVR